MMSKWVFEELRGAAVRRDPNETELFKTEQTGEGEYAGNDALVREIIQNSIDARVGSDPVKIRLAIHELGDAPDKRRLTHYFERLRKPLASREIRFDMDGCPKLPCRFLVCEDFGTRGLEGNVLLDRDPSPEVTQREDFYWFWRNIGRSGKTGEDLGRWGLGKSVYRAASRVGCMFGLTVRRSDHKGLLMGQAVLQIHGLGNRQFMPEGYWCRGQNMKGLPLPIANARELKRFRREWHLTRTDEPGLSVVAPFVHKDLRAERLLQAVAVHFFARIVRGELAIEILGHDLGRVTLDSHTIEDVCAQIVWDGPKRTKRHVAPPIAFAKSCFTSAPTKETLVLGTKRLPTLNDKSFADDQLHHLRRDFSAGELIGVSVRFWLPRRRGDGQEGQLNAYLQRASDGIRCDSYYVREGMTITKISSRAAQRGIQSLVIVDPGPLAELLGDAEGPAHEDWDTSVERPDRTWKTWKGRVKFVRRIVDGLVEVLTPATTEPDFDLLSDFFSIERPRGDQQRRKAGDDSGGVPDLGGISSVPKWFQITQRAGGFTVGRSSDLSLPKNAALRVSVAYDIPRGDPLRNWNRLDFVISDTEKGLHSEGRGVKAESLRGNTLLLTALEADFQFTVDGFDRHRDLFIRVDDVSDLEEATV